MLHQITTVLTYRVIFPLAFGALIFLILHWTTGLVANIIADEDLEKLEKFKFYYMIGFLYVKDALGAWALGMILLMVAGIV